MWGPQTENAVLDCKVDEMRLKVIEDERMSWLIIEANTYDNEAEGIHTERLTVPIYMLDHLLIYLPRFADMLKQRRS